MDKQKKPFYKIWWVWAIAVVVLFSCIASCAKGDNNESAETTQSTSPTESTAETTAPQKTTPATAPSTEAESTSTPPTTVTPSSPILPSVEATEEQENNNESDYVLNTNSLKFHYPSCSSAKKIKDSNKEIYYGTREDLVANGYSSCGICHP